MDKKTQFPYRKKGVYWIKTDDLYKKGFLMDKKGDDCEDVDTGEHDMRFLAPLYFFGITCGIVLPGILLLLMNLFPPVENIFCSFTVVC